MKYLPEYPIQDLKTAEKLYGIFRITRISVAIILFLLTLTASLQAENQKESSKVHQMEYVQLSTGLY